ncbi:CCAAT/enhancer-binding protein epsilon [Amphibalanus amphitrite]|uniref:CCAAT/enhancer-binding protein epsilon n=1 Tax=Amphibalanus amphitrite TaxID=1232801 RepID=A0A6A4VBZ9_AMPAM|nr:CCAAT/enhancer-binding protein epsilon [Amphibalanus amphitrite]
MESPQMYDLSDSVVKPSFNGLSGKTRLGGYGEEFGDLADLGASEVSLDLQAFVNDPHFSDGIFTDIVEGKGLGAAAAAAVAGQAGRAGMPPASCAGLTYPTAGYLPQPMPYTVPRLGGDTVTAIPVKKDPDAAEFQACRQPPIHPGFTGGYSPAYASLTPVSSAAGGLVPARLPTSAPPAPPSRPSGGSKHSPSKRISPGSEEYRRRRERNNVAVRKSREKAKMRCRETEERVKFLSRENEGLHKRVEMMTKELTVLKNLFANVGVLPEQLQREIAKHLGDGFGSRPAAPPAGL